MDGRSMGGRAIRSGVGWQAPTKFWQWRCTMQVTSSASSTHFARTKLGRNKTDKVDEGPAAPLERKAGQERSVRQSIALMRPAQPVSLPAMGE